MRRSIVTHAEKHIQRSAARCHHPISRLLVVAPIIEPLALCEV
jgi:hypothetical protein